MPAAYIQVRPIHGAYTKVRSKEWPAWTSKGRQVDN